MKRLLALLLAIVMTLGCLAGVTLAAETTDASTAYAKVEHNGKTMYFTGIADVKTYLVENAEDGLAKVTLMRDSTSQMLDIPPIELDLNGHRFGANPTTDAANASTTLRIGVVGTVNTETKIYSSKPGGMLRGSAYCLTVEAGCGTVNATGITFYNVRSTNSSSNYYAVYLKGNASATLTDCTVLCVQNTAYTKNAGYNGFAYQASGGNTLILDNCDLYSNYSGTYGIYLAAGADRTLTIKNSRLLGSCTNSLVYVTDTSEIESDSITTITGSTLVNTAGRVVRHYSASTSAQQEKATLTITDSVLANNTTDIPVTYANATVKDFTFTMARVAAYTGGSAAVASAMRSVCTDESGNAVTWSSAVADSSVSVTVNGTTATFTGLNAYSTSDLTAAAEKVIEVDDEQYATLAEAVAALKEDGTSVMTLLASPAPVTSGNAIDAPYPFTLNLNGYTLTASEGHAIVVNGTGTENNVMTINGAAEGSSARGKIVSNARMLLVNAAVSTAVSNVDFQNASGTGILYANVDAANGTEDSRLSITLADCSIDAAGLAFQSNSDYTDITMTNTTVTGESGAVALAKATGVTVSMTDCVLTEAGTGTAPDTLVSSLLNSTVTLERCRINMKSTQRWGVQLYTESGTQGNTTYTFKGCEIQHSGSRGAMYILGDGLTVNFTSSTGDGVVIPTVIGGPGISSTTYPAVALSGRSNITLNLDNTVLFTGDDLPAIGKMSTISTSPSNLQVTLGDNVEIYDDGEAWTDDTVLAALTSNSKTPLLVDTETTYSALGFTLQNANRFSTGPLYVNVTADEVEGAVVNAEAQAEIGKAFTFTLTKDEDYKAHTVYINDEVATDVDGVYSYTPMNLDDHITIKVTALAATAETTTIAVTGDAIASVLAEDGTSLDGASVERGSAVEYTVKIDAAEGYEQDDYAITVTANDEAVDTSGTIYTTGKETITFDIKATLTKARVEFGSAANVTLKVGETDLTETNNVVKVTAGEAVTITGTPAEGYTNTIEIEIDGVAGDTITAPVAGTTYTVTARARAEEYFADIDVDGDGTFETFANTLEEAKAFISDTGKTVVKMQKDHVINGAFIGGTTTFTLDINGHKVGTVTGNAVQITKKGTENTVTRIIDSAEEKGILYGGYVIIRLGTDTDKEDFGSAVVDGITAYVHYHKAGDSTDLSNNSNGTRASTESTDNTLTIRNSTIISRGNNAYYSDDTQPLLIVENSTLVALNSNSDTTGYAIHGVNNSRVKLGESVHLYALRESVVSYNMQFEEGSLPLYQAATGTATQSGNYSITTTDGTAWDFSYSVEGLSYVTTVLPDEVTDPVLTVDVDGDETTTEDVYSLDAAGVVWLGTYLAADGKSVVSLLQDADVSGGALCSVYPFTLKLNGKTVSSTAYDKDAETDGHGIKVTKAATGADANNTMRIVGPGTVKSTVARGVVVDANVDLVIENAAIESGKWSAVTVGSSADGTESDPVKVSISGSTLTGTQHGLIVQGTYVDVALDTTTVTSTDTASNRGALYLLTGNHVKLTAEKTTFENTNKGYGIWVGSSSSYDTLILNDCTVTAASMAVYLQAPNSSLTMTGGTATSTGSNAFETYTGENIDLTLTDVTINAYTRAVLTRGSNSDVVVSGCNITASYAAFNPHSTSVNNIITLQGYEKDGTVQPTIVKMVENAGGTTGSNLGFDVDATGAVINVKDTILLNTTTQLPLGRTVQDSSTTTLSGTYVFGENVHIYSNRSSSLNVYTTYYPTAVKEYLDGVLTAVAVPAEGEYADYVRHWVTGAETVKVALNAGNGVASAAIVDVVRDTTGAYPEMTADADGNYTLVVGQTYTVNATAEEYYDIVSGTGATTIAADTTAIRVAAARRTATVAIDEGTVGVTVREDFTSVEQGVKTEIPFTIDEGFKAPVTVTATGGTVTEESGAYYVTATTNEVTIKIVAVDVLSQTTKVNLTLPTDVTVAVTASNEYVQNSVIADGSEIVQHEATTFTVAVTPAEGYEASDYKVYVNGTEGTEVVVNTLDQEEISITVTAELTKATLAEGTLTNATTNVTIGKVTAGEEITVTAEAEDGYEAVQIIVDGELQEGASYTFKPDAGKTYTFGARALLADALFSVDINGDGIMGLEDTRVATLAEAAAHIAADGKTVLTLLKEEEQTATLNPDHSFTLDLGGKTLKNAGKVAVDVKATATGTTVVKNGTVISNASAGVRVRGGNLEIDNATILSTNLCAVDLYQTGTATVKITKSKLLSTAWCGIAYNATATENSKTVHADQSDVSVYIENTVLAATETYTNHTGIFQVRNDTKSDTNGGTITLGEGVVIYYNYGDLHDDDAATTEGALTMAGLTANQLASATATYTNEALGLNFTDMYKWSTDEALITWVTEGTKTETQIVAVGSELTVKEGANYEDDDNNYFFTGWAPAIVSTVTENATYTAQYNTVGKNGTVTIGESTGAAVTLSVAEGSVAAGTVVTVTATPTDGYENPVTIYDGETALEGTTFTVEAGKEHVITAVATKHTHTEVIDAAVAPTCTATGLTDGKHCEVCGEVLKAQTVVDALGHTEVVDAAVAPTCTATGLTDGKHCEVCGEVLEAQTVVDALGHTEEVIPGYEATLNETGLTDGKKCSVCGETLVEQQVIPVLTGAVASVNGTKYATLADAIANANNGDTVTLLADVDTASLVKLDKAITLDLGGKTITRAGTADAATTLYVTANVTVKNGTVANTGDGMAIWVAAGAAATLEDVDVTATTYGILASGNVTADAATTITATKVGSECGDGIRAYGSTVSVAGTINASSTGTAIELYRGATATVTGTLNGDYAAQVYGGKLDATAATLNGTTTDVLVSNDTTASDVTTATVEVSNATVVINHTESTVTGEGLTVTTELADYEVKQDGNSYGVVAKDYVAEADGVKYETLAEAIANGTNVTLLANTSGSGVVINKNVTIDFGGYTYTFTEPAVGSTGTESNGFQILQGNTVTLKNGTLTVDAAYADKYYMLIQNYADLTVTDMTLDGTNLDKYSTTDGDSYVLSNNSGAVVLEGATNITANDQGDKAYAFDSCQYASYAAPTVTVNTTGTIAGNVEVTGGSLALAAGTVSGELVYTSGTVTKAETVTLAAPEGYKWDNGTLTAKTYVAEVNGQGYETLEAAVAAAKAGTDKTVTLIADVTVPALADDVSEYDLDVTGLTIDLNGKTLNVPYLALVFVGENFTIKNGFVSVVGGAKYALWIGGDTAAKNVTVDGVTTNGGINVYNASNVVLKNNTVTGIGYYAVWADDDAEIIIESGSYTGAEGMAAVLAGDKATGVTVSGGIFSTAIPEAYCAAGFIPTANNDGTYGVKVGSYVAQIGETKYETLADAIAVGGEVTLLADVTIDTAMATAANTTLVLNGKTVTVSAPITVTEGTTLKVTGEGKLIVNATVNVAGVLDVNDIGYGATGLVPAQSGSLAVTATGKVVLMSVWASYDVEWLNANSAAFFAGSVDGAQAVLGEKTYTRVNGKWAVVGAVASIEKTENGVTYDKTYASLTEAIADAKAGETVKLLTDVTITEQLVVNGITLDGNGKTLNATALGTAASADGTQAAIYSTSGLTVKNLTIDGGVRGIYVDCYKNPLTSDVVLENVNIENSVRALNVTMNGKLANTANTMTVTGGKLAGKVSYASSLTSVTFEGVTFTTNASVKQNVIEPWSGTSFVGCTFTEGYTLSAADLKGTEVITKDDATVLEAPEGYKWVAGVLTAYEDASLTITVGEGTVVTVTVDGTATEYTATETITVPYGAVVTATVAAADGYKDAAITGDTSFTAADAGVYEVTSTATACDYVIEVDNVKYEDFAAGWATVTAGSTVTLLADVTIAAPITVTADLTIDGNGKTLTYTGKDRAITVENTANGAALTVKNLTVVAASAERGINYNTTGTLTLEGVTVTAGTYAVNLPGSSDGATVDIDDSELTAKLALNVWGSNMTVTVDNTDLTSVGGTDADSYAAIQLNNNGTEIADGTVVTVTGGTITATAPSVAVANWTATGKVNISDTTFVNGESKVVVATIGAAGYYTLEEAITDAKANDTIKLLTNASGSGILATGAVLDLNGYTVTGTVAGIVKMNGGTYITADNYAIAGPANAAYLTDDAVFEITATNDITVKSGTVTLGQSMNTMAGQTLTVADEGTFIIPTGTTLNVYSTVIVDGTLTVNGTMNMAAADATVKAAEGLNITTTLEGKKVDYTNGTYTVADQTFTVTWLNWNGDVLETDENVVYGTVASYDGETPVKTGDAQYNYTFLGWDATPAAVTADVTYTAVFTTGTNSYTVNWIVEGITVETDIVEYGQTPEYNSETPTKAATAQYTYTFEGWEPAVNEVTGNVDYVATFTSTVNEYTITWVVGEETTTTTVAYGETPVYPNGTPVKEGDAQNNYTFAGWTPDVVTVTGEAIYTAQFSTGTNSYTVTWYDEDGTTVLDSQTVAYGETPVYGGQTPTKAATAQYTYTFEGWNPAASTVTGNQSYVATYSETVNSYTITWVVGEETTTTTVAYGETPVYPNGTPVKEGDAQNNYTFAGWTPDVVTVTGEAIYTAAFTATAKTFAAEINGQKYETLEAALTDAASGQTVKLLDNTTAGNVTVPAGVTLDLNGNTLTADAVLADFTGAKVVDSAQNGLLQTDYALFAADNGYLPLYDEAAGGYRMAKAEIKTVTPVWNGDTASYIFRIDLTNAEWEALIKNQSDFAVGIKVTWGTDGYYEGVVNSELVNEILGDMTRGIKLTFTGLPENTSVTISAYICAKNVTVTGGERSNA